MKLYKHRITLRISDDELEILKGISNRNYIKKSKILHKLIDSIPNSTVQRRLSRLNQITNHINNNLSNINKKRTSNFNQMVEQLDHTLDQISARDNNLNQISRQVNKAMQSGLGLDCNKILKKLEPYLDEDRVEYQTIQKYNDKIINYLADSYKKMSNYVQDKEY